MAPPSDKSSSITDLEGFDATLLKKAVVGLNKFLTQKNVAAADLLDTRGEFVMLQFDLSKIPPGVASKPIAIELPHPIYRHADVRVCLITRDPQKKWKELMAAEWKPSEMEGMEKPKIIGLTKLKANYPTMANKRELSRSFDLFLCDNRIVDQMPRVLGRTFIDCGKLPIDVSVKESTFLQNLMPKLQQTYMRIRTGTSVSVKIGHASDPVKHLYQNALAALRSVSQFFNPSISDLSMSTRSLFRDNEIRSVALLATDTPALPVYIRPSISEAVEALLKIRTRLDQSESEADVATNVKKAKKLMEEKIEKKETEKKETKKRSSTSSQPKKKKIKS